MSGGSLSTKGLVSGGGDAAAATVVAPTLPPGFATTPAAAQMRHDAHVIVVIPTAINTCLMAAENISDNLRAKQSSNVELPSMYKRAYLVVYETDEIALVRQ